MPKTKKSIICFGGGNAMPKAILIPLKKYPVIITSITSMTDSGGSSGQLRKDFNVLPPGDMRRHILALSEAPEWKKQLWTFKFGHEAFEGGHKGHVFANIFLAGTENTLKDYSKVLDLAHEFMEVSKDYKALPATVEKSNLYAKLENGTIIKGESEIDVPKEHDPNLKIIKVYLKPEAKAFPPALEAVEKADVITIGPGDLYSSIIPCFLMKGMKASLKKSKAKKIFICNTMTKLGETNNFSVLDFSKKIEKYLGANIDRVIYNSQIPSSKRIEKYKKEEPSLLDMVKIDRDLNMNKFITGNLLLKNGPIIYDPDKLAEFIMSF